MDPKIQEMIAARQEANRKIIAILSKAVERHPDLRFGQILSNYNLIPDKQDIFYVESVESLDALKDSPMYKITYSVGDDID